MDFLDTNVLVYAADPADPRKHDIARRLVRRAVIERSGAVSMQVLTEYANVALKKLGKDPAKVAEAVSGLTRQLAFVPPSVSHLVRALEIHAFYQLSLWDSLVIAAAEAAKCDRILSEDLNDGQRYCGILARNPF